MTIYIVRASHANEYELQNYAQLSKKFDIKAISSRHPLTNLSIPTIKLWSPTDLSGFPFRRQIFNRMIGGEQWLLGLEQLIHPEDILHTAETYTPYTHQAVMLRQQGKIRKLVCTCWETIPHNNTKIPILKKWKTKAYRYVDIFHTPTVIARDALISEGVSKAKIKVIPYGIDQSRFAPVHTHSHSRPVVLTVARKVPEKGYAQWLKISSELADLADFRWVDDIPYNAISKVYKNADIFFLPSQNTSTWEEQYGMVLVEAMTAALPIVTTSSGAIPEVVGDAALLSAPSDISNMRANLLRLINYKEVRHDLVQRSNKRSKKYDIHMAAERLATLYT